MFECALCMMLHIVGGDAHIVPPQHGIALFAGGLRVNAGGCGQPPLRRWSFHAYLYYSLSARKSKQKNLSESYPPGFTPYLRARRVCGRYMTGSGDRLRKTKWITRGCPQGYPPKFPKNSANWGLTNAAQSVIILHGFGCKENAFTGLGG